MNDTELVGGEITYLRPKRSRWNFWVDVILYIAAIVAIATALWGMAVTNCLPIHF